jgi:hypothetical protein
MVRAMTQPDPLPRGADIALRGLGLAHGRLREGVKKYLRGDDRAFVAIALSEALHWIAVLDDHGREHVSKYSERRDSSPSGRTVGGLVYARNFHAHELISTKQAEFNAGKMEMAQGPISDPYGRGPSLEMQLRWTALQGLALVRNRETRNRDQMYDENVAERPLTHPISDARAWLESTLR